MWLKAQEVWTYLWPRARWATKVNNFGDGSAKKQRVAIMSKSRESFMYNGSFHEAIRPVLSMGQCFAVMPVGGVRGADPSVLHYTWMSVSTWYSLLVLVLTSMYTVVTICKISRHEMSPDSIGIFFLAAVYAQICFIQLARRWPGLMQKWDRVERELPEFRTQTDKANLSYQIKVISITVMTLSLCEHILNILSLVYHSKLCNPVGTDAIRNYFMLEQSQLYEFFEYSPVKAFLCKFVTVLTTFLWTFIDLFVVIIGLGLSTRFRQINENLMRYRGMPMPEQFWTNHRSYYRQVCDMCRAMDDAMSNITLLSFGNNLFFVCNKLFNCFNVMPSIYHALYFWFSLVFLIVRTVAVLLYLSQIHDESKKPIRAFRFVPRDSWCLEVKRFAGEVKTDFVALSGNRFFYITRKMLMSVTGTIVTYELVLLQFRGDTDENVQLCK